jgi:homoserine kinase type II
MVRQIQPNDRIVQEVLAQYPPIFAGAFWASMGNAGGFSGASVRKGVAADGQAYCLRAWPLKRIDEARLSEIHRAMLVELPPIVPRLVPTNTGGTWVAAGGRFWEITTWMPGVANFHEQPNDTRLFAAMRALASIHDAWTPAQPRSGPCPAVRRIIAALRSWRELIGSGWRPDFQFPYPDGIDDRSRRAWEVLHEAVIGLEFAFLDWETRPVPLQTCFCDVWHDHILYDGDVVSGVIDFGAVKEDCVAIDLARLLGSMIPDETERMSLALAVYSAARPVSPDILRLAPILDRVGFVVGLTNWLRWLYYEHRPFSDTRQVARRMDILLKRLERKKGSAPGSWGFEMPALPKR